MEMPIGYKFFPKDYEIITLLMYKIHQQSIQYSTDFIADAEVFSESPPWILFEDYKDFTSVTDNGIYFFSKVYKIGNGIKNSQRTIPKYGSWKCETKPKEIEDPKKKGNILGFSRDFSFKGEVGDKWWLTEYCLPEDSNKIYEDTTSKSKYEYVICKLKEPILKSNKNSQEAAVNVVQHEYIQPAMPTDHNEQENIQSTIMPTDHNEQENIQSTIMPTDHNEQENIQSAMETDYNFTVESFDGSFSSGAFTTQESTTNIDYELQSNQFTHLSSSAVPVQSQESIQSQSVVYYNTDEYWQRYFADWV